MRTTHDEEITPSPCIYCDKLTFENPEHIGGLWSYAHTKCEKLAALSMEETANKKLRDDPDDPILQFIAECCERMADQVCAGL